MARSWIARGLLVPMLLGSLGGCAFVERFGGALRGEEKAIFDRVADAQAGGLFMHDLEAYMDLWAEEARIVGTRSDAFEEPMVILDRSRIEATRRIRFTAEPLQDWTITYEDCSVIIDGDSARVEMDTEIEIGDGSEVVHEIYLLRKEGERWLVTENRWWPVRSGLGGETTVFDSETWALLDGVVETARAEGPPMRLANACFNAYRFIEAHEAAKEATLDRPAQAGDLVTRGFYALFAGDAEDAQRSFKEAIAIDPNITLPQGIKIAG